MKKWMTIFMIVSLTTGCSTLSLVNFNKSECYPKSEQGVEILLMRNEKDLESGIINLSKGGSVISDMIDNDKELQNAISSACVSEEKAPVSEKKAPKIAVPPAVVIPVITVAGKLIFDLYMDKKIREVEELKKAAQVSYSGKNMLPAEILQKCNCAVLVRYKKPDTKDEGCDKKLGLIAIVKIKKQDAGTGMQAFTIQPFYVKANNAVAVTAEGKAIKGSKDNAKEAPKIDVSIGIAVKAIGKQESGLPGVFSIGEGAVSVPNIEVGPGSTPWKCENCPSSDLIPYPVEKNSIVSVGMSVMESGKIGIDLDQSKAELKAIKEALGPAFKESLKEYLTAE